MGLAEKLDELGAELNSFAFRPRTLDRQLLPHPHAEAFLVATGWLCVPAVQLRKILASTNVIESAFAIVERVCANVKRWHPGDQRERWVGSGLLVAEKQFRKVKGYKLLPLLLAQLEAMGPPKLAVVKKRRAS